MFLLWGFSDFCLGFDIGGSIWVDFVEGDVRSICVLVLFFCILEDVVFD